MADVEPLTPERSSAPPIVLTILLTLVSVLFVWQELLVDSRRCDVSCGNLVVDVALLVGSPILWLAALIAALRSGGPRPRLLRALCLVALAIPLMTITVLITGNRVS